MEGHSNLYVYGLPAGTDDAALKAMFETIGTITSVKAVTDRRYGFVRFASTFEAQTAINTLNGQIFNGSRITVLLANRDSGQGKAEGGFNFPGFTEAITAGSDILVKGLPPNLTNEQVKMIFEMYGAVTSVQAATTETPDNVGETAALIKMSTSESALWMVNSLNGNIPQGLEKPLSVTFATLPAAVPQKPIDLSVNRYSPYGNTGGTTPGTVALPDGNSLSLLGQSQSILGQPSSDAMGGFPKGYKTRLCTQYAELGMCPRGDQCTFAHGGHEVKGYKTKLCKYEAGLCPSGDKCSFAHNGAEVRGFKSRMCKFESGQCPQGDKCSFAHSAFELQLGQQASTGVEATQPSSLDPAQANPTRVAGLATEALLGAWGSLSATDLSYLGTLGIDLNTLLALSQQQTATEGTQPALSQSSTLPTSPIILNGNGTGTGGKGGFKTRLCTYFTDSGVCPNGNSCTFAHGAQEIHGFKTRMCRFAETGGCPQGSKCSFAHNASELQTHT